MQKNFASFYTFALNADPEERAWLHAASVFMKHSQNKEEASLGIFFDLLLKYPDQFTAFPYEKLGSSYDYNNYPFNEAIIKEWSDTQLETARALLAKEPQAPKEPKHPVYTPENLKLAKSQEPKQVLVPFELNYQFQLEEDVSPLSSARPFFQVQAPQNKQSLRSLIQQKIKNWKKEDPSIDSELTRLEKDFDAYDASKARPIYNLEASPEILKEHLKPTDATSSTLRDLELEIVTLANTLPTDAEDLMRDQLQRWGGTKKAFKLDELIVNFAKQDTIALQKRNPALTEANINELYRKVGTYLLLPRKSNNATRAEITLKKLEEAESNPKKI